VILEDASSLTTAARRDARRRVRIGVAVYAFCLVALLLAGAYLAPANALDAPNGTVEGGWSSADPALQVR
jgi:hypothetical protein